MICQSCGASNRVGVLVCDNCGDLLVGRPISAVTATLPLPADMEPVPPPEELPPSPSLPLPVGDAQLITFEVGGSIYRATLDVGTVILVGRDIASLVDNMVLDLASLGAFEKGVSRRHAVIHVGPDSVYLIDVGSTNGTFLNGRRLEPRLPSPLRSGDTVHFGRLPVRVRMVGTRPIKEPAEAVVEETADLL